MTCTVAYSELTRVLPWSLRALGYPFGTADRAAHLVATAAALNPAVLDCIAAAGQRSDAGFSHARTADGIRVTTDGCSLFETGPVVMDYLAAHCPAAGIVTARIGGAVHLDLLPAILLIGADYGLNCIALRPEGGGWYTAQADSEDPRLGAGDATTDLLALVDHAGMARLIAEAGEGPDLIVLATREPLDMSGAAASIAAEPTVAAAHSRGIPVSRSTLEALYELETITWAPTSERSRAQAGFIPRQAAAS